MLGSQLRLDDGFSTIITLSNIPTVKLYEKEVTPPSYSAGGGIDTTTMRNTAYRTQAPKQLKSLGNVTAVCAYATEALQDIWPQIGVNQEITITFPDGATLVFWGWIDDFKPSAHTEGEQPTATVTIICGMRNSDGDEVAPAYTESQESSNA